MESVLFKNARIISGDNIIEKACLLVENGLIKSISDDISCNDENTLIIDAKNSYLAPGFIDLHFHGIRNIGVSKAGDIEKICKMLPEYGVTGFLPSVIPEKTEAEDVNLLKDIAQIESDGASILGILLEGHFLTLTGALKVLSNGNDDRKRVKQFIEALGKYKAVFCISPEYEEISDLLPLMTQHGMPAFITHTGADYEKTACAIEKGAVHATHFYNVFPYIGDREPGVRGCGTVEAVYSYPDVSVDFILDGEHVEPGAVKMAIACKGIEKVCLITDANVNSGLGPGKYRGLGDIPVEVRYDGGPARIAEKGLTCGTLAGSGLTMDKALRNAVSMLKISVTEAVKMVSSNPAEVLGLADEKGYLKIGYDADIVMLDEGLNVEGCWIDGIKKY